jgi:CSLREA domain-containing protein
MAVLAAGPALWCLALGPTPMATAQSTSFVFRVDSTADAHDANPGDGACDTSTGTCTLRAALEEADALPAGSKVTVDVPAGTYDLSLGSLYATANEVTVAGAGRAVTVVTAKGASRDLFVGAGTTATVEGLMISGGNAGDSGYGGGIESAGTLTVERSVITANTATAGGGLANAGGTMVVTDSQVSGNSGVNYGGGGINNGGILNAPGTVSVSHSTFTHNVSGGDGGAILNGQNGHPATSQAAALAPERDRNAPRQAAAGLVLTVKNSTFSDNRAGNGGGAVANDGGTASVTESTLDSNSGGAAIGGAISSYGSLRVSLSTLDGNTACYGGGIELFTGGTSGTNTVSLSTISDNHGCVGGGLDETGSVTVTQSTFSRNRAPIGAAMEIEGSSSFSLANSTVSANVAQSGHGAVETFACSSGTVSFVTFARNSNALALSCHDVNVTGTILAGSTDGANCSGAAPTETAGYNLDSGTSCALSLPTDLTTTHPRLGPLADNGGPTPTMALEAGSPAIDHGGTAATGCPATDQRGVPRPQGPACDIGAFEVQVSGAS